MNGDYWVGGLHRDEDNPASIIGAVANSCQDHKIWDVSSTGNAIIYSLPCHGMGRPTICETALLNGTNQFPTPNGASTRVGKVGLDVYWFAIDGTSAGLTLGGRVAAADQGAASATVDQVDRGKNYGNLIDWQRAWSLGYETPDLAAGLWGPAKVIISTYIENFNGNWECRFPCVGAPRNITPQEANWAVGASLIHGARDVVWFANGAVQMDNTKLVDGVTVYDQIKATDRQLQTYAPVLNAPFALGYVTASPAGYGFPIFTIASWYDNGIGTMAKVYNGHFYVFAMYDGAETDTNIAATFTIKDTGLTRIPYALFGTSTTGMLTASAPSGGTRTVSYTFSHAYDVLVMGPI